MDYKKAQILYRILTVISLLSLLPLAVYNRLIIVCLVLFLVLHIAALAIGLMYMKCPHCGRSLISGRKVNYCPYCGAGLE